jgi:hypothetical protein
MNLVFILLKFIAIILGLIFLQLSNDQQGIQNKNGLLFLLITNASFSNMFVVINVSFRRKRNLKA